MPTAIFIKNRNDRQVKIINNPGVTYDIELWEQLKSRLNLTDQQLADRLNNTP